MLILFVTERAAKVSSSVFFLDFLDFLLIQNLIYNYKMTLLSDEEVARELDRAINGNQSPPDHLRIPGYEPANNVRSSARADLNSTACIVDSEWELLDPTPDVQALFRAFDERFFKKNLQCVQLEWSKKMYNCAGICYLRTNRLGKACTIRLSEPLLKLRSRKDLIETLLHEMIHAYCFVQGIREGNGGHGPTFISIMRTINQRAGTNITVYHSFHDEVELYRTHVWRCNGICQHRGPFYGYVKRTMNRAPGPSDYWWIAHQQSCGGTFEKKSAPEKPQRATGKKPINTLPSTSRDIRTYFTPSPKKNPPKQQETPEEVKNNVREVWNKRFASTSPQTSVPATKKAKTSEELPKDSWKQIDDEIFIEDPEIPVITLDDSPVVKPTRKLQTPAERQSQIKEEILESIRTNGDENDPNDVIELIDDEYNDDDKSTVDILLDQSVIDDLFGKDTLMEDFTRKTDTASDNITCPVCQLYLPRGMLTDHMEGCLGIMEHIEYNPKKMPQKKHSNSSPAAASKSLRKPRGPRKDSSSKEIVSISSSPPSPVPGGSRVPCPVCSNPIAETDINDHLDLCLTLSNLDDLQ
ncbi:DNA-dependent metalloprotease dvc-1 [Lutzomyia longipalpis]|uniref:DNA-dependent metalloprotease dvc-1 n=1 Tax=Lutzomyia longipalpis TaxID=7200 RepID=UPI0024838BA8|nr:DNA-dependent metalloprotease dvc-1 [Lutzomyia longipalpis]